MKLIMKWDVDWWVEETRKKDRKQTMHRKLGKLAEKYGKTEYRYCIQTMLQSVNRQSTIFIEYVHIHGFWMIWLVQKWTSLIAPQSQFNVAVRHSTSRCLFFRSYKYICIRSWLFAEIIPSYSFLFSGVTKRLFCRDLWKISSHFSRATFSS